jgi:hypothetical protein
MPKQLVRNQDLASDTARLNLLTNPGFEIWGRGNTAYSLNGNGSSNGALLADRWQGFAGGDGTGGFSSMGQQAGENGVGYALNFQAGSGNTGSVSAPGFVYQMLQTGNLKFLSGKTVTFSARVETANGGVRLKLEDSSATNNYYSAYHPGNGTWQTLSVTGTISTSSTNSSVKVLCESAAGGFVVDNATLVVGLVPMTFVPLHPHDDLDRCLRYYEMLGPVPNYPQVKGCATGANINIGANFAFAAKKAGTPTLTTGGTWVYSNVGAALSVYSGGVHGLFVQALSQALGEATYYSNGSGYFAAEYNP